jgi:hypothetical protein
MNANDQLFARYKVDEYIDNVQLNLWKKAGVGLLTEIILYGFIIIIGLG